ncbi:MAG: 4-hydroxy-tetrahydrodipicolinate synthase [Deltaproteobacteria bacterium]|nr:MAG: 4-hydroxy-tetrahydrodipicolinate synthase [Deltaproteobacteria bacterium]
MARYEGTLPAIVTPLKDGVPDLPALSALVDWLMSEGADGIVACGTTGEGATLRPEEVVSVARTVKEVVAGRGPVIVGTGSNDTARTIEMTRRVREVGVDGALVVTPYYNKPSPEGLYQHYAAVAREGGLPVLMYNVPGRTGLNMSVETMLRCAAIEGVVGVKDASKEMEKVVRLREALGDEFSLLSGDDFTILPFVACGGDGVVTVVGNVAPRDTAAITRAVRAGDLEEARHQQAKVLPLASALFVESNPIPVKAALAKMGKCREEYRLPLCPPSDPAREVLYAALEAYGGLL